MKYRKLKADNIFTGIKIFDNEKALIVTNEGKIADIINVENAGDDVENFDGMLCPGFINAHCHLELSHLKNIIPEKTGLVDFVYKVVTERHFETSEIIKAMQQADQEMWKNGIAAVGDICNNSLSLEVKQNSLLQYHNFIEVSGWNPAVAQVRYEKSKQLFYEFTNYNLRSSIIPHAPYSVSKELWGKIAPSFFHSVIGIHNQETKDEDLFFEKGKGTLGNMYEKMGIDNSFYTAPGKRSVETYFDYMHNASSIIFVHNTFTKQQDINYINQNKSAYQLVSFCFCPIANQYIEQALPDVNLFIKNDCNIVIGTDSLASNHQLNILEELKTISKNFPEIKLSTLLKWATINGARALQMDDLFGSFEIGKRPGVILIKNISENKLTPQSIVERIL